MEEKQTDILTDKFGRFHNYLRISLTDRCNLRCTYCMPESVMFMPSSHLLLAEEIDFIVHKFVKHGVTKIRLTGGEPLLRKDFSEILDLLSKHQVQLSLTTNGFLLDLYLSQLVKTEISSINISLDSLRPERFKQITQRNYFSKTIENIKSAINAGLHVKLNAVIIRNFNDDEILEFVKLSRDNNIDIRFIEFMPFRDNKWGNEKLVTHNEILGKIQQEFNIVELSHQGNQTAQYYQVENAKSKFGIISTVSRPFCNECNRLRITADGKLKNCLLGTTEYDLKSLIRTNQDFIQIIQKAVSEKYKLHGGVDQFSNLRLPEFQKNRSMVAIGG